MERLLLVAPDPAVTQDWAEALREDGWTVEVVASAGEAIDRSGSCDLVVCDSELPDGDGVELGRHLRRRHPGLPILVVAASAPERLGGSLPGDFGLLIKPFPSRRLVGAVATLPRPAGEPLPPAAPATRGGDRQPRKPSVPLVALLLLTTVAGLVAWTATREQLPSPSRSGVSRSSAPGGLAPRGDVAEIDELRWNPVDRAVRYVVWLRRLDESVAWQTSTVSPRTSLRAADLRPRVPYEWEVEAFDASGRRIGLSEPTPLRWIPQESR